MSEVELIKDMLIKLDNFYRRENQLKIQISKNTNELIKLYEEIKMLETMIVFKMKRM